MITYIQNFKRNDQFYFNGKKYTVIQKRNESKNKEFCIKATYNGIVELFYNAELEVETIIPDILKSIESIDELIEKSKTDKSIDVEDLKAEKRNAFLLIKKAKRQFKNIHEISEL